jgi:hypothetical protein
MMKKLQSFFVTWCFSTTLFGQSILLKPASYSSGDSPFNVLSTNGLYGNFSSTSNVNDALLNFRLHETGDGSSGSIKGQIHAHDLGFEILSPYHLGLYGGSIFQNFILINNFGVGIGTQNPQSGLHVKGFTKLGDDAPKIKVKKITGTTAATQGNYAYIPHALNSAKIIDVQVIVNVGTERQFHGWKADSGYEFDYYIDTNNIRVLNVINNSIQILNSPLTIYITYEE